MDLPSFAAQFHISPDSRFVAYTAITPEDGDGIYVGRTTGWDGVPQAIRVTEPMPPWARVDTENFVISPDSRRVLYLAEQESPRWLELFSTLVIPAVDELSPDLGPSRGGNVVTITGRGFTPEAQVTFGGKPAEVTFVDSCELRVIVPGTRQVPPAVKGPAVGRVRRAVLQELSVPVQVSVAGLEATLPEGYTYRPGSRR